MSIPIIQAPRGDGNGFYLDEKNLYRDGVPPVQYDHQAPQQRGIRPGTKVMKVLRNIFVPSFFRSGQKSDKRPNAGLMALDGLRGLACLAVVNQRESSLRCKLAILTYTDTNEHFYRLLFDVHEPYLPLWLGYLPRGQKHCTISVREDSVGRIRSSLYLLRPLRLCSLL